MKLRHIFVTLCMSVALTTVGATHSAQSGTSASFQIKGITESMVKTGTRQYLVYFKEKDTGITKMISIWNRTTSIIEQDGERLVETTQTWASDDNRFKRELYSLNRLGSFAPVAHVTKHGLEKTTKAYLFSERQITSDPSVAGNTLENFTMNSAPGTLNWELDIETFALLPLGLGKSFALNFYHPGSKTPPKDYIYTVVGDETLRDFQGNAFDSWQLRIDYNDKDYGIFWLSKKDGQMLKMEESWGNLLKYKVRLGLVTGL